MDSYAYLRKGHILIKPSLEAFLISHKFFFSPPLFKALIIRRLFDYCSSLGVSVWYTLRLYKLNFSTIRSQDRFIVRFAGGGGWSAQITLRREEDQLYLYKELPSQKHYDSEKRFYDTYKCRQSSKLKFPKCEFFEKRKIVKTEFVELQSWERIIRGGGLSFNESLDLLHIFFSELDKVYSTEPSLIHGDLFISNVLLDLKREVFFVIDYTDSHEGELNFDKFTLLYSILRAFDRCQEWKFWCKHFCLDDEEKHFELLREAFSSKHGRNLS